MLLHKEIPIVSTHTHNQNQVRTHRHFPATLPLSGLMCVSEVQMAERWEAWFTGLAAAAALTVLVLANPG